MWKNNELNLDLANESFASAIAKYTLFHDSKLSFDESYSKFKLTPDKPYSAKASAPAYFSGQKFGELVALILQPGEGTGNDSSYGLDDVLIPGMYRHRNNPERAIPRSKEGIIFESYFPLFTLDRKNNSIMFAGCLDELTLADDNRTIKRGYILGQDSNSYIASITNQTDASPIVQMTVGYHDGKRFGDPHAIFHRQNVDGASQAAGFLGIKEPDSKLLELIYSKWAMPRQC